MGGGLLACEAWQGIASAYKLKVTLSRYNEMSTSNDGGPCAVSLAILLNS